MKKIKIYRFAKNIWVCELYLPWYASEILKISTPDYRKEKSLTFRNNMPYSGCSFSDEEMTKINSFPALKKQVEWSAGRICIKKLAGLVMGKEGVTASVSYRKKGAPYLQDYPDVYISISHSGNFAMALLKTGPGRASIDVETVKSRNTESIVKVALSEKEKSAPPSSLRELIKIFTIKEAFMKYIEQGFHESLKKIEIIDEKIFHNSVPMDALNYISYEVDESHIATVVYEKKDELNHADISTLKII